MRHLHSPQEAAPGLQTQVRGVLHTDSRRVSPGDGFIAWPGAATDGRRHVPAALAQGATACLVEHAHVNAFDDLFDQALKATDTNTPQAIASYTDLKAASGPIAAAYYEQPSQALDVLAITGTNGKTSTAWWLAHALGRVGQRCAVVGTLGVGEVGQLEVTGLTTPDPVLLQARLRDMVARGVKACAIEASSIGLAEHRLEGTQVRVALFTNFTQDHLDYHGSMEAYWAAKRHLFAWPGLQSAVINVDDIRGAELAQTLARQPRELDLWTTSAQTSARLQAHNITSTAAGLRFEVLESGHNVALQSQVIGSYNVNNLLGVLATLRALGVDLEAAVRACQALRPVPGRLECLGGESGPLVVVDYAHTPDALAQSLDALRPIAAQRGGQLWCVFGCGGDRDAEKRPLMGAIAAARADHIVITNDNPRNEKPTAIVSQILAGLTGHDQAEVQVDRGAAIASAIVRAAPADLVLLAGKGHEETQDIAGVKSPFSDRAHALRALALRNPAKVRA